MHDIHKQKPQTHEIIDFVQISNEPMKLVICDGMLKGAHDVP
jgi:hypothetical protein